MSHGNAFVVRAIDGELQVGRDRLGYAEVTASSEPDMFFGLGYMHALDRQVQMWLTRIIGRGQGSQHLDPGPEMIEVDRYMRWIDLAGDAEREVAQLTPAALALVEAYCRGVNAAVRASSRPLEFRLVGYRADPWTVSDVLLVAKMIGYVGLASTQADSEKFIIQLIQAGLDEARLKELFPPITETITPGLAGLLKGLKGMAPIVPAAAGWKRLLPAFSASNNWVVGPGKSASGTTILSADPHLNFQLPNIWYQVTLRCGARVLSGASVAGTPAVAVGRTGPLAWAATYGTMDLCDHFVEELRDGQVRRGDRWVPVSVREEIIRPKKGAPITLRVASTDRGTIEGESLEDGHHLALALSIKKYPGSAAQSLDAFFKIFRAGTVAEAMDLFAGLTFSPFNWVLADEKNIGYQLGGLFPGKRPGSSGLLPYLGWEAADAWQGPVDPRTYPRAFNPEGGVHVTANNDLNAFGQVRPMTLPMASYRADLIRRRLDAQPKLGVEDMKRLHLDRYSLQAETFMALLRPLLPATPEGRALAAWDLRYTADSVGATHFENVYLSLVRLVFGELGIGPGALAFAMDESVLFPMLHGNFDAVLLSERSAWFAGRPRQELFRTAIERGLALPAPRHGEARRLKVANLFFGGKLPGWLGFDHVLEHVGSRATIPQSQAYRFAGRDGSFAATFRLVTDLATRFQDVALAGGASGSRFSPYYKASMAGWEAGRYHRVELDAVPPA
jgi:penicillin amidase